MRHSCILATVFALALVPSVEAQGSAQDYARAASLSERYRNKVRAFRPEVRWLEDGSGAWWVQREEDRSLRYVRIDLPSGKRRSSAQPQELGLPVADLLLTPQRGWKPSRNGGEPSSIEFVNRFDRPVRLFWVANDGRLVAYGEIPAQGRRDMSTYDQHVFVLDFAANDLAGVFTAQAEPRQAILDEESRRIAMSPAEESTTPPPPVHLEIRDHNVVAVQSGGSTQAWTEDGSADDAYESTFHWSPDGRRVLGFQTTRVETREIPLIDSRPDDQVQPRLSMTRYRKPGDRIPQRRPRLFDVAQGRAIPVDDTPFQDSFSVGRVHWLPDSSEVTCLTNQRGHQRVSLHAIHAETGAVRTIVEERSKTFVDYSQKLRWHWLKGGKQLLWASERSGHNHLYLVDAKRGQVLRALTQGPWQVRGIEAVDEERGVVFFRALGVHAGQDPYFVHGARVDLDGSNLRFLTEANGSHRWTLSPDHRWFLDRWSRIDQPSVTELRSAETGKLVAELGRDDASELLAAGYVPPEAFVAKGRDGETDIYGIITRPSNFDPKRRYPVIEQIYAGPHDHFVPKTWGLQLSQRRLADLGFLVVQIDGMGTNWRGKAFHDVCWQNLQDAGLPDRIAWMQTAAKVKPEMDLERVGIYGGSAGGQSALAALLHHGDFYDAAAADCGCHDNRMDKIWWNEAWMGRMGPHYADNSNVTHAHQLQGDLLLTVGELDRNVDPASTLQVVDALIAADKDFEFVWVPGAGHGVGESPYLFRRRQDFFVRALYGLEPRH